MNVEIKKDLSDKVENSASNPVTRKAVNERTHELAKLAKRTYPDITQGDYEKAKREITGETDIDKQNTALDATKQ
ncbi:hypothetical protein N9C83_02875 [Opitutales bacterium]|nr:hypothetical protein [Opitutales bacterium]